MSVEKARAWKELTDLSYLRVSGTEGEKKAAEQLKAICEGLGVEVVVEPFDIDKCDIHSVSLTTGGKEYTAYGINHSGSTPEEGITAPVKYIGDGTMEEEQQDIKGKIVLTTGMVGGKVAKKLKEKGAVGFICTHGSFIDDEVVTNGPRVRNMISRKANPELPGVGIHLRDAEDIVRNHNGEEFTIKLSMTSGEGKSQNVIATIPGTTIPEEVIVLSAHYDTVIHSTGSWDNASGSVTLLEIMHHFKANPPKRTVKFLWCGCEEIGLVGSQKYCEQHKDELDKVIYNVNIDMVGVTLGKILFCGSTDESVLHALQYQAKIQGFPVKSEVGTYSSDSTSFAGAGVPAASFGQESTRGGAEIHNYRDTMEHMDPDSLIYAISFICDYVDPIANAAVNPIPRKFAPKVEEALKHMKEFRAEMDGEDPEKKDEEKKEEKPEEKK